MKFGDVVRFKHGPDDTATFMYVAALMRPPPRSPANVLLLVKPDDPFHRDPIWPSTDVGQAWTTDRPLTRIDDE